MCDILTIDDSDEELRTDRQKKTIKGPIEEIQLSDSSDSDDIIIEAQVINTGIEYIGRKVRPVWRRKKRAKQDLNQTVDPNSVKQQSISSDSNQSHVNNGLKTERITPKKTTSHPIDIPIKTSPVFHQQTAQSSSQSSSQTIIESQISNSEPIKQINSQEITSTVPAIDGSDVYRLQNDSSSGDSTQPTETSFNDIGVEADDNAMDVSMEPMDTTMNLFENFQPQSQSSSDRTSTPIPKRTSHESASDTTIEMVSTKQLINETVDKLMVSPSKEISDNNNNEEPNNSVQNKVNENNQTINDNKSDKNQKQDIAIDTRDLMYNLSLNEWDADTTLTYEAEDTANELICSYDGCGQEFNDALLHYKHEKKHLKQLRSIGIKTFICQRDNCEWSGYTQVDLMYHNSEHCGIYLCSKSDCMYRAVNKNQLIIHMNSSHKKTKKKSGQLCRCGEQSCLG